MDALKNNTAHWIAALVVVIGLIGILLLHLTPAYFTGLIIYFLIRKTSNLMPRGWSPKLAHWIALFCLVVLFGFLLTTFFAWIINHIRETDAGALERTLALGWEGFLNNLSPSLTDYLPKTFTDLRDELADMLGTHWGTVGAVSRAGLHAIILAIVGIVIGALIAFEPKHRYPGFFGKLAHEVDRAALAFWNVISAQSIISFINTFFTLIYILIILPHFNVILPYPVILVLITFIAGLLPVLGNVISNTVIVLISFTVSGYVALASLIFLVTIHKLEYFLNAKIIGIRINAKPWELLIAFFVGEAAFGLAGLMVAPFYYGYYKLLIREMNQAI